MAPISPAPAPAPVPKITLFAPIHAITPSHQVLMNAVRSSMIVRWRKFDPSAAGRSPILPRQRQIIAEGVAHIVPRQARRGLLRSQAVIPPPGVPRVVQVGARRRQRLPVGVSRGISSAVVSRVGALQVIPVDGAWGVFSAPAQRSAGMRAIFGVGV